MKNEIGKIFMEKTQHRLLGESEKEKGATPPVVEMPYDDTKEIIDLPSPKDFKLDLVDLKALINQRSSVRKYSKEPISLEELSYLLWCTQGVKKQFAPMPNYNITLRTVPSAGARHPFETILLINNVLGIKRGLYRYIATKHKMVEITLDSDISEKVTEASEDQRFINNSAVTFIWIADIYRTNWVYGERGYRYVHLDAGHVCQNLYLAAESINSGVCAIAAFDDKKFNDFLGLDGENQFVIYVGTLGKKPVKN